MAEFVAVSLNPVFYFALHSNTIHFLCTPWQYCRTYGLDLPTSSVITGMRGAKAGISPPRRSPPCMKYQVCGNLWAIQSTTFLWHCCRAEQKYHHTIIAILVHGAKIAGQATVMWGRMPLIRDISVKNEKKRKKITPFSTRLFTSTLK